MMPLLAIGFDLDNTLYDQGQHFRAVFSACSQLLAAASGHSREEAVDLCMARYYSIGSYQSLVFNEALAALGIEDLSLLGPLKEAYLTLPLEVSPFPGTREALAELRRNHRLFVITDGHESVQERKLEALRLSDLFDKVVVTGALPKGQAKPHPASFLRILEDLSLSGADCVYVGDNALVDITGAQQAGMKAVLVETGAVARRFRGQGPMPDLTIEGVWESATLPERLRRQQDVKP